jgi:diguanylate cyclase (GGDEF)-like protein
LDTKRHTVLVVDDTPATIETLFEALCREHEVLFATSGREAIEIALDHAPDLILLDVVMPDMDGYDVCAQLKANPRTQSIPVIFVTAMDQEEDEARGLSLGAIDYIFKPIRPAVVQARVRNHLELKRHRDLLENLSTTDGLTGIPNRRQFDTALDREWRRARRLRTPLALAILDIDLFKAYNDRYGHLAGDDCLRQVARTVASSLQRPADVAARYGGEEFACILPDTDVAGAVVIGAQILAAVTALSISHGASDVNDLVTLSCGAAAMVPGRTQPGAELIRRADLALYQAKHAGRNRVVAWRPRRGKKAA